MKKFQNYDSNKEKAFLNFTDNKIWRWIDIFKTSLAKRVTQLVNSLENVGNRPNVPHFQLTFDTKLTELLPLTTLKMKNIDSVVIEQIDYNFDASRKTFSGLISGLFQWLSLVKRTEVTWEWYAIVRLSKLTTLRLIIWFLLEFDDQCVSENVSQCWIKAHVVRVALEVSGSSILIT